MRKVYAIGESLIDIIFSDDDVKAARPGGSMLNSAVSLGRAGININFLSEYANDKAGGFITNFLEKNGVNTQLINRFSGGKTPLALAFLNEKGDASYEFYKQYPPNRLQGELPDFNENDIFLFGSFFGIDPAIHDTVREIAKKAHAAKAIVIYDPNFRKPHIHELDKLRPVIIENISNADIIRASNEDMEIIFNESDAKKLREKEPFKEKVLIITRNAEGIQLDTPIDCAFLPSKKIEVVSTIGAGDNFNAGLIYGLLKYDITHSNVRSISAQQWDKILGFARTFASDVCMSYDNYISTALAETLTSTR